VTLDTYTLWLFLAGMLAGVGLDFAIRAAIDQAWITRYLAAKRRRPAIFSGPYKNEHRKHFPL